MTAPTVDRELALRALHDVGFFARAVAGAELWPHQVAIATSPARIRCVCAGRQSGKTRTLAVLALFEAFSRPGSRTLILSAGEDAARDVLAEASALAGAPLLAGSVVDDLTEILTLANGSTIRSIPASEKRARGKSIDLLILDEAAYIDEEIWRAARYTILARPASRVVMASTPRGRLDRFFATHWRLGGRDGVPVELAGISVESFHWPSSISPLVDEELIEFWRRTDDPRIFQREVLAEWADEASQYFSSDELDANVAPYSMLRPGELQRAELVVAGVDWASAHDANAVVMLGVLAEGDVNGTSEEEPRFFVAWAEERYRYSMNQWARDLAAYGDTSRGGFEFYVVASEANGVGSGPTELLQEAARDHGWSRWRVQPVWTTAKRKASGFGVIRLLLQQNRLLLPAEPSLRRQLEALELTTSDDGNVRISVPESQGHDDQAMALLQGASCLRHVNGGGRPQDLLGGGELVETPAGVRLFERPRTAWQPRAFRAVRGADDNETGW